MTEQTDRELFEDLVRQKMPFGRYEGRFIFNLPEAYLNWFQKKGFPNGRLGLLLATMYEIKLNGLEYLLEPLKDIEK